MADEDEDIAALVVDNGSGMCKGTMLWRNCYRSPKRNLDK
jgi:hypothetical protein